MYWNSVYLVLYVYSILYIVYYILGNDLLYTIGDEHGMDEVIKLTKECAGGMKGRGSHFGGCLWIPSTKKN